MQNAIMSEGYRYYAELASRFLIFFVHKSGHTKGNMTLKKQPQIHIFCEDVFFSTLLHLLKPNLQSFQKKYGCPSLQYSEQKSVVDALNIRFEINIIL